MLKHIFAFFVLQFFLVTVRADLVLVQQVAESNHTATASLKIHDNKMRMDREGAPFSVIVDLKTRDSLTLLTNKTYIEKSSVQISWEMKQEQKHTHGTNEMDLPAAPAIDTGRIELVNGTATKVFTWTGAYGYNETLWVATNFPGYDAMRGELHKLDAFNDAGPHRNAQPALSALPGMVIKSVSTFRGRTMTNTLVSAKIEPVDPVIFDLPVDYKRWTRPTTTTQ